MASSTTKLKRPSMEVDVLSKQLLNRIILEETCEKAVSAVEDKICEEVCEEAVSDVIAKALEGKEPTTETEIEVKDDAGKDDQAEDVGDAIEEKSSKPILKKTKTKAKLDEAKPNLKKAKTKAKLDEAEGKGQPERHSVHSLRSRKSTQEQIQHCKSHVAQASLAANMSGGCNPDELQVLFGLEETKDFCSGTFVDFMERSRAHEMRLLSRVGHSTKKCSSTQQLVTSMTKTFTYHKNEVHYERMRDSLMQVLIKSYRDAGDKHWAKQGVECLRKHALNIMKSKQKKKCLGVDVNYYEIRYKLSHPAVKILEKEKQDERHDRLKHFFKKYHEGQSNVDLQRPCSHGQLRLVNKDPKIAHHAFSTSLAPKQIIESLTDTRHPVPSEIQASPLAAPEDFRANCPSTMDAWKLRTSRGHDRHVSHGMDVSRMLSRELSKLPSLPPVSPSGQRDMNFGGEFGSPESAKLTSPCSSPIHGGYTTLTGGWGFTAKGHKSRDEKHQQAPEALTLTRLERSKSEGSSLNHQRKSKASTWSPSDWQSQHRSSTAPKLQIGDVMGGSGSPFKLSFSKSAPLLKGGKDAEAVVVPCKRSSPNLARRERGPFISPWSGSGALADHSSNPVGSPTGKYLRESELNYVLPKLIPFTTGHSDGLRAKNQALNDCDLLVIGTMLPGKSAITEVDLDGNALLTEKSLVPFLNKLHDQPVEKLSLNHCLHYALPPGIKETLDVVQSLISDSHGLKFLRFLDLSGIQIGARTHVPLCQAIQEHPRLTDVRLADIGIGGAVAKECIGQLMSSTSIEVLDLSWNSFSPDVFRALGERLSGMYNLLSLCISNCSSSGSGIDNPVAFFLEYLSRNTRLTHLDVSTNRITFRGALVLEDALEQHKRLSELTISNNPIGVLGMRNLLRLLSRDSSGLMHIVGEGVAGGTLMEALGENMQIFRFSSPSGRYCLNLARPYHRSLLRMLCKTCDRLHISPEVAFKEISYSKGTYTHPVKDADGLYAVPHQGKLNFVFNIVSTRDGPYRTTESSRDDFGEFLSKYENRVRLKVGFKKIVPMLAYWKNLEGRAADQIYMLEALSKDFAFRGDQIEVMCRSRLIVTDILWRLMPCIMGGAPGCFVPTRLAVNMPEFVKIYEKALLLESFNPDNPTGHYKLNLENPSEFHVAEQLVLLDRWEVSIAQALDRPDVSQKGNMSHVRNEKFQELPILGSHSIMEWQLPEWDSLEFDYVSGKRMPSGTKRLDTESFKLAMVAAQQAGCDESWQVLAFRKVSHHIKLSAKQLRQLLSIFPSIYARQDIFVTFYTRITDIVNEKVCRVRFDDRIEVPAMRQRLGHMTFFPFIQPEQAYFEFELAHYDGRLALAQLLTLAAKESRMQVTNIHDYEWKHADGKVDPMPTGIPPGWSFVDKVPPEGIFMCTYNCAPEDRDLHARKYLLEHFGFWSNSVVEKEKVNWWATIRGTPNDVCEFLYFLVMRYKHVWEAFTVMDGICGNKQICYKEFEEGYEKSGCKKFKGKNKSQRLHNVFRYLDPSGEGTVSEQEWELLDELFKEITFSVREFVWFLDRTFENLDDAWVFLDQDGNDVLDFQEFTIACEKIGYFGHAKSIFSFLDKDGEGTISFEEFLVVQNYSEKAENLREDFHEP